MLEGNNFKRKRANRSSYTVNPDGNCTPSDSDTDDEQVDRFNQRKIVRRHQSSDNDGDDRDEIGQNDADGNGDENSNHSHATSTESQWSQGNSQLLYAALEKLQELEHELAELDEADYDSGHHDDDDDDDDEIDEGNGSDFESAQQQQHNHRNDIVDGEAEALGFAFCVKETFEYLAAQGVTPDNPVLSTLRDRFLGQCNRSHFND